MVVITQMHIAFSIIALVRTVCGSTPPTSFSFFLSNFNSSIFVYYLHAAAFSILNLYINIV